MLNYCLALTGLLVGLNVLCSPLEAAQPEPIRLPQDSGYTDVTQAPYSIVPDGKTDCTDALQKALDLESRIYLPPGTYLVSGIVHFGLREAANKRKMIQGAGREHTIIRLSDSAPGYQDTDKPKEVLRCANRQDLEGPANAFRNAVRDLAIDVGRGNPGAIAIFFYAHNQGIIANIRLRSPEPSSGWVGLDLYRGLVGPCLQKNIEIEGFQYGIRARGPVRQLTFEQISLKNQGRYAVYNNGNILNFHQVTSHNQVPAFHNRDPEGHITVVDATLSGGSEQEPAVDNENGFIYLRDVKTEGYGMAVHSASGNLPVGEVREYSSHGHFSLFPSPEASLRLPIEATPVPEWAPPETWRAVANQPETLTIPTSKGNRTVVDYSAAVQAAIDSGAETVYFPELIKTPPPARPEHPANQLSSHLLPSLMDRKIKNLAAGEAPDSKASAEEQKARDKARHTKAQTVVQAYQKALVKALKPLLEQKLGPQPEAVRKDMLPQMGQEALAIVGDHVAAAPDADAAIRTLDEPRVEALARVIVSVLEKQKTVAPPDKARSREEYTIYKPVILRGNVKRLFVGDNTINALCFPWLIVADGKADTVFIERLGSSYTKPAEHEDPYQMAPGLLIDTTRTVVLHSMILSGGLNVTDKPGKVFLEDFCSGHIRLGRKQVWGRQVNPESMDYKLVTRGGSLWLMGLKTERGDTVVEAEEGARVEVLGGMLYGTTGFKAKPAFLIKDSSFFATVAESTHNGFPFETIVRETRATETRELKRWQVFQRDGYGMVLPFFSGWQGDNAVGPQLPNPVISSPLITGLKIFEDTPKEENRRSQRDRWALHRNLQEDCILLATRQSVIHRLPDELKGADWIKVNPDTYKLVPAGEPAVVFEAGDSISVYLDQAQEGWKPANQALDWIYSSNWPAPSAVKENEVFGPHAGNLIKTNPLFRRDFQKRETVRILPGPTFIAMQKLKIR